MTKPDDIADSISQLGFFNAVFVFDSNLVGHHTRGNALDARKWLGAQQGVASGMTGECYAIPTKDRQLRTLPLRDIADHVTEFLKFAASRPALRFQLTRIGCGMSAYKDDEIAPLFAGYGHNVILPGAWNSFMSRPSCRVLLDVQPGASAEQVLSAVAGISDRVTGNDVRRSIICFMTSGNVPVGPLSRVWRLLSLPDPVGRFTAMPPEERKRITSSTQVWFCSDLVSVSADRKWRSSLEREAREARLNVVMA